MGNQTGRGRNQRGGGPSQMSAGGRPHYEQTPSQYPNRSPPYYHHQQQGPPPLHMGLSYHQNNDHNRHQPPSGGSRQRLNSNRSNNGRNYQENNEHSKVDQGNDLPENPVPAGRSLSIFS